MVCIDNYGNLVTYEDGYSANELYHHGILGQRWGRKNGPPYPLGTGDHSASEKKAGWRKSLGNIAKATGSGVARGVKATARGVGKGVVGTAKGVAAVAKGTKKALIRVNLYPKQLMSDQDIVDKLNRMDMEAAIKRARGKMTAEDKLNLKLKKKDARRELAKTVLGQLIPAIGKDLIIRAMNDRRAAKLEIKKKEAFTELENDSKRLQKELENDSKRLQTELDIKKSTVKTNNDIREHEAEKATDYKYERMKQMDTYDDAFRKTMYEDLVTKQSTRNGKTISPSEGLKMIKDLNDDYGARNTERLAREAKEEKARKAAATKAQNQERQRVAQERLDTANYLAKARAEEANWESNMREQLIKNEKSRALKDVKSRIGATDIKFQTNGILTYRNVDGKTEYIHFEDTALNRLDELKRKRVEADVRAVFGY